MRATRFAISRPTCWESSDTGTSASCGPGRTRSSLTYAGWEFGGTIAGHLVGQFPHETIDGDEIESFIAPGSDGPMRRLDSNGQQCHWILEVNLVDRARGIGGFYEELLDLPA